MLIGVAAAGCTAEERFLILQDGFDVPTTEQVAGTYQGNGYGVNGLFGKFVATIGKDGTITFKAEMWNMDGENRVNTGTWTAKAPKSWDSFTVKATGTAKTTEGESKSTLTFTGHVESADPFGKFCLYGTYKTDSAVGSGTWLGWSYE
jgi:hypothetical protein